MLESWMLLVHLWLWRHSWELGLRYATLQPPPMDALHGCSDALHLCQGSWAPWGWHDAMVFCSRLQLVAPTGRSPFAARPLDPFPP